ncbi:MAG: hypothetical protein AAF639_25435, partial [Chloroflexota bacterium]
MPIHVTVDAGPAVHQKAGLSRYTERLITHLADPQQQHQLNLTLFYNQHSGHHLPQSCQHIPTQTIPLTQYPWRLSVLATQLLKLKIYDKYT